MTKKTQKKLRKALLLISCAALLVCITVGVTVAYLTSSDSVTNEFSVGNVTITMDEATVNEYGKLLDKAGKAEGEEGFDKDNLADRTDGNKYKLVPSHTYTKDPTIYVDAKSEDCYLFVKVENGLGTDETTIATQLEDNGWTLVDGENNVYYHEDIASANDEVVVFETFTFDTDANPEQYKDAKIVVTAYAVQEDGFSDANAAWTGAKDDLNK